MPALTNFMNGWQKMAINSNLSMFAMMHFWRQFGITSMQVKFRKSVRWRSDCIIWVCRTWIGREVNRFWTSSWGEVPWVLWQTFQPQSQSLVFLSLELETAVVALWILSHSCREKSERIINRLSPSFMSRTVILRQTSFSLRERVQFISLTVQFKRPWSYWCWEEMP